VEPKSSEVYSISKKGQNHCTLIYKGGIGCQTEIQDPIIHIVFVFFSWIWLLLGTFQHYFQRIWNERKILPLFMCLSLVYKLDLLIFPSNFEWLTTRKISLRVKVLDFKFVKNTAFYDAGTDMPKKMSKVRNVIQYMYINWYWEKKNPGRTSYFMKGIVQWEMS
jgi:hypothetical protein